MRHNKSTCEEADAFIVLTKQGIVLASDDAKLTPQEDSWLYNLNQVLIKRALAGGGAPARASNQSTTQDRDYTAIISRNRGKDKKYDE